MKLARLYLPRLRALLCAPSLLVSAYAQDPTVNVRFVSFPKAANPEPVEILVGEGETMEVELPTNSISQVYKVPAMSTWALGKRSTKAEGEFAFDIFGKTQSNGAKDQLILVVRKGQADSDGLELTTIKSGGDGFGGGKYFLMNATKVDIAGAIGTGKFALKPGAHSLIAPEPTSIKGDRKYCYAKIFFKRKEEVQPFFSSTWRFNGAARSMVFFYHDPNSGQLEVHTIRSFAR